MTDSADGRREAAQPGDKARRAGGLAATERPPAASAQVPSLQRWVNEGGSLAPGEDGSAQAKQFPERKEARDTVAGCRNRAVEDRCSAATTDTENGRQVLERSAASWEKRADEMEETENASAQQRAVDRELWASEERRHPRAPD